MNASLKRGRAMRLTRVYVDGALTPGSIIDLPRETGAHLSKVLRVRSGDELVLFNGDGREFIGAIDAVRGSRVSASIGAARSIDRESPCRLTLVQCIPRGDRMDFIVQKATELGVARIVPVLSQRSVVRLDAAQSASKQAHWRAVAVSACEQCGRNRLPTVEAPQPLLNYLGALAPPQPRHFNCLRSPVRVSGPGYCAPKPPRLPPSLCCKRASATCRRTTTRREPPTLDPLGIPGLIAGAKSFGGMP
jgi:16S rRNA U1498 N3-methylase RsmE